MAKRTKILYKETYAKDTSVAKECLPVTRHTNTYQPRRMDLLAAGTMEMPDGTLMEFHDVRLFFPKES